EYDHDSSKAYLYFSESPSRPATPQRVLNGFSFSDTAYYLGFGAATGGLNQNHYLRGLRLTYIPCWGISGSQPAQPSGTLPCYQNYVFNPSACIWDIVGTQPSQPSLACYQSAAFNSSTCQWDVTGTQPTQPTGLAANQVAVFDNVACSWSVVNFTCGTSMVSDVDNNTYATVQIGTQCWTQSNLKVSKYRNGDNIPTGLDNSQWSSTSMGAYAVYNNDAANDALYGKLYNWYAVNDSRGLCPTGWHVPSHAEWMTLINFLGGVPVAGGKMKSTATQPTLGGWNAPNTGATNSSGFTGLPGGELASSGGFTSTLGNYGFWWSTSDAGTGKAYLFYLSNSASAVYQNSWWHRSGFSVRCLRDAAACDTISVPRPTSTLPCYQDYVFNPSACIWDIVGTQPVQPSIACYET
ncbi:MAG: FISUMP domain-containing protein, partial [Bacteroidota bacterium]